MTAAAIQAGRGDRWASPGAVSYMLSRWSTTDSRVAPAATAFQITEPDPRRL